MVSRTAYRKDIGREIRRAPGRFLSLLLITALGVAIYVGVQYTPEDMRLTARRFYRAQHLQDIHLLSVYGFNEDDLEAARSLDGLSVSPSYARDALVRDGEREQVARLLSLPPDGAVNRPLLLSGRMPERDDECLVDPGFRRQMGDGDSLTLAAPEGENVTADLTATQLTIVGVAQDPRYISGERGNSALGNGRVQFYVLLPESAFSMGAYTELNVSVDSAAELDPYSEAYQEAIRGAKLELEELGERRARDAGPVPPGYPAPKWHVFDRDQLPGFVGYEEDTAGVKSIAAVFPVIFFLVAALVSLTSMTRMVEEHRMQIGTYKALGYGTAAVQWKYVSYALLSSLLGGLAGIALGRRLLPCLINNAYSIVYDFPPLAMSLNPSYAVIAVAAGVVSIVGATLITCGREIRPAAAMLLRPKPPGKGKRILLERVTPVWRRMSFISKVTARNLFRYKKRFLMTMLGITGCTALLLTGFGLSDSITDIAVRQFEALSLYGLQVNYRASAPEAELERMHRTLDDSPIVDGYILTRHRRLEMSGKPADVNVVSVSDPSALEDYLILRNRKTKEPVPWADGGALISEKLSYTLDVGPGGTLTLVDDNHESYDIPISGIVEHYVNHYVFMTDALYARVFGESAEPNCVYARLAPEATEEGERVLAEELTRLDAVGFLMFTSRMARSVGNMIKSMDFVVYVLLVSAAALAFIVLFNLTNINISERVRELATIKVLGFTGGELAMYMYRENLWLTLFGALSGLVGGYFLHRYIILTVEVEMVMFCRDIHLFGYLASVALTFLFAMLVNLAMYPRLAKIDMVESLKSVE